MGQMFLELPAPAGNGAGTPVDVSQMGAFKTIVSRGSWGRLPPPTVNIEINNAEIATDGSWAPACESLRGNGVRILRVAARWMRQRVSGLRRGFSPPEVFVGGTDDGATFASLPVPDTAGVGAPVDVSELGELKTLQIGGRFSGAIILEISEDAGGATWAQWQAMQAPGQLTDLAIAHWARIRRLGSRSTSNVSDAVLANLGGAALGSGGSTDTAHRQVFAYTVTGLEPDKANLVIPLPAGRLTATYQVQVTPSTAAVFAGPPIVPTASRTLTTFVLSLPSAATTGDVFWFTVEDPT